MTLGEFVSESTDRIVRRTAEGIRSGRLRTLGEVDEFVTHELGDVTDILTGDIVQPYAQKAIDAIKPALMQALEDYTPTFAAVSGGMLALAVLLGVYVSKQTFEYIARRRGR